MTTSFKDAFKNQKGLVPAYLVFLNLGDRDLVGASITLVDEALKETPQLNSEVISLFRSSDWRPHLVGAITCLLKRADDDAIDALWSAFDCGSWVQPQLGVAAFYADRHFTDNVLPRLRALCPIRSPRKSSWRNALLDHIQRGPGDEGQRSAKGLASLLKICDWLPQLRPEVRRLHGQSNVVQLIEQDHDRAGDIASYWNTEVTSAFERFGKPLQREEDIAST